MRIAAQTQNYTRHAAKSKGPDGPDDVPPEFPGRNNKPGPDDVYDPDFNRRGGNNDYSGPGFYEGDSGSGGGGCSFLG